MQERYVAVIEGMRGLVLCLGPCSLCSESRPEADVEARKVRTLSKATSAV